MNKNKTKVFQKNLSLKSIQLLDSVVHRDLKYKPGGNLEGRTKHELFLLEKQNLFYTKNTIYIESEKNKGKKSSFFIEAVYLTYFHVEEKFYDKEVITEFAKQRSVSFVWPYFREFVSNMTSRMGLPALTLDLLIYDPVDKTKK